MRATAIAVLLGVLLAGCGQDDEPEAEVTPPTSESSTPTTPPTEPPSEPPSEPTTGPTTEPTESGGPPEVVATVATDLEAPWGLDFFANGDAIVTERDSRRVLRVSPGGRVRELGVVEAAVSRDEGGLLGVALSPDHGSDSLVYLYLTTATDNRVVRAELTGNRLGPLEVLLDGIPAGDFHDGGRLEFGPDGLLYVSTGETYDAPLAQDRESLGGKVLRLTPDGDPAPGNPFDSPVYSWGHRNVQGLAFDDAGTLWASEFGDQTFDELNRIEPGANYGWPEVEGTGGGPDFVDPQQTWDVADASPSGLAFADGHLWMASLRGERLWRVRVEGRRAVGPAAFFVGDHGRMRTVALAPDGSLWVTTSNRDGRGTPAEDDDRILRVQP